MADPKQPGGASPQTSDIVEDVTSGVTAVASKVADTAKEKARGLASAAEDKARALAEEQKRAVAEQAESVAKMVDGVAAGVEAALPPAGPYVRGVASEIHRVSSMLRDRSVDDFIDDARDFARNQPGTVIAGALVVGFGLARFLKASADRRHDARARQPGTARQGASRGASRGGGASRPSRAEYPSDVASEGPGAAQDPGAQGPGAHGAAPLAADRSSPHGR